MDAEKSSPGLAENVWGGLSFICKELITCGTLQDAQMVQVYLHYTEPGHEKPHAFAASWDDSRIFIFHKIFRYSVGKEALSNNNLVTQSKCFTSWDF